MEKYFADSVANLYRLLTTYPIATSAVSIACGLLWCFFGYRIFRVLVVATFALIGGVSGYSCAGIASLSPVAAIVGGLMGGIVGGVLGFFLLYVSVFLLGMGFMGAAGWVLFSQVGHLPAQTVVWSSLVVGGAGGLLALLLMRPLLIVYTAMTGSLWVVATIVDLIVMIPALKDPTQFNHAYSQNLLPFVARFWPIIASCVLFLFGAGVVFQFSQTSSSAGQAESEPQSAPSRKAKAA